MATSVNSSSVHVAQILASMVANVIYYPTTVIIALAMLVIRVRHVNKMWTNVPYTYASIMPRVKTWTVLLTVSVRQCGPG